ncbi:hypothetical protein BD310DRAFT_924245 [Dichomitus squalens]|uniref:Uncharacterized protein n=1 Tax=Dichomitus squalens TaxID=114155 RepID=A0A4Q9PYG3_9APHY|nr:hypothetical protein BD310DRAFT_924245 [Dichomitus squalens]
MEPSLRESGESRSGVQTWYRVCLDGRRSLPRATSAWARRRAMWGSDLGSGPCRCNPAGSRWGASHLP